MIKYVTLSCQEQQTADTVGLSHISAISVVIICHQVKVSLHQILLQYQRMWGHAVAQSVEALR
jgi:hypothetical protein